MVGALLARVGELGWRGRTHCSPALDWEALGNESCALQGGWLGPPPLPSDALQGMWDLSHTQVGTPLQVGVPGTAGPDVSKPAG